MLAFKLMDDQYGILTFCADLFRAAEQGLDRSSIRRASKTERVGRMVLMHANTREEISEAYSGDIVALVGLKDTRTGDTLCDPSQAGDSREDGISRIRSSRWRSSRRPRPTRRRWRGAPQARHRRSILPRSTDQESGQTIIKGMGELHLDIKVDILKRTHKVEVNVGAPQVAYRETITRRTEVDYTHKKQTGGTGQLRGSRSSSSRNEKAQGFEFENKVVGGVGAEGIHSRRRKGAQCGDDAPASCRLSGR